MVKAYHIIFFIFIHMLQDNFFPKLVDLFRMCEGSRNMDGLHMIFRLVKGISM
jgi:hypothetical protein